MPLTQLVADHIQPLHAYDPPPRRPGIWLDANESPWPLPEQARQRITSVLAETAFQRYPDPGAAQLRETLATTQGGHSREYVLGSGSDELIALMLHVLSKPREGAASASVAFPWPTFVMYELGAQAHRLTPLRVPLDKQWQLDPSAWAQVLTQKQPNLVFLATPNNPTGNRFDLQVMRSFIEAHPHILFVLDQAYGPYDDQAPQVAALFERFENVALLGTLSKIGLAAIRLGWCRIRPALAAELHKVRQPYNVNALTQATARLALTELKPTLDQHVQAVVTERTRLTEALSNIPGLTVHPSHANFLVVQSPKAKELHATLQSKGIYTKHLASMDPRLTNALRITVGTLDENNALLETLSSVFQ